MKQLWCSLAIISLLITATLLNVQYLKYFTAQISTTLTSAQQYANSGDFDRAKALTQSARDTFESHAFYLHITLAHRDIDNIEYTFSAVLEYLSIREGGALYLSSNAYLLAQFQLLVESEQLNLKNIL